MPVRDKVYEKMKSFGLTDSKEDFYKYYDSDENVRKDVFRRLQEDGLTDTEEEFYSYMQPSVVNNEEPDTFDANVERAKNGEPIQRVSTQSMIDAHPELGLKNIPNLPTLKDQVEKSNVRDGKPVFGKPGFNGNEVSALYPMSSETLSNRLSDPRILDKDMSIRSVNEADEEKKIDAFFHSKPMKTAKDVYDNYSARFSNTERGIELGEELSDISRTITDKYANEYFNSDSYKKLAKLYQGEELANKANEEFQKTYGETINKELKPYQDAYNNELSIRYGSNMDEALRSIAKESVSGKLSSLTIEVESMLKDSEEKLKQHRPIGGKGLNAIMGNQQYLDNTRSQRKERNMLESAQELLDDSQNIVNEASKKGNTTFIEGLARGFWDNLNAEDFTFGLAELADMKYLNEALKKAEQGEQLTPAEEKLLEASTINMATQAYFSSDLGRGYKAGSVTAESIPFMLEFIANPISGSGNAIAKGLLKFGLKRFGKSMTSKTAKAVGRLIGDATAAVGMTSTTGMPSVLAETYNRLNRNYNYGVGEDGELYVNKEGDTSFGEAFGKSFTTRAIENQSEMIFHAFKGAGNLLKGVDATLPGGVNTFFDYIKNSKVGELWRGIKNSPLRKELAEATKVGGIGEEYLEEVYNNFANVALGEMSMEEALNLDNNIDTFLGLAPTQVMFSMLGLGNMAALRYKTRRDIEDLRATMNESQRQALDGLLAMGTTATNQDVREFIRNTMANQSLSIDEKRNAVKAAYDVARQKAMADVQEAEVEDKIAEENADIDAKTDPQTGNYGEVTLLGMDESGEPTANTANVFGAKIVDGELYLLVLPEGETEKKWVRPHEYDAESHQIMPGAEVKAYNEQMIRDNAAKQVEEEAKYAPDVLNAQMQQGVPFEDETAVYVPFQVTPEGNAWQVEVYNKDENGKPSKDATGVNVITNDQFRDILQTEYDRKEMQKPETEEPKQRGTVSTPVALAYLLEGGQNSIENLGYFLHGVAAAFPELENEIETIRGNIGEGLGVSPDRFAEVAPREMAEMRQVIESKYGKEGSTIFDELVANSTGYVPKVGAEMALRLENLKPIQNEGQQPAQEAAVPVNVPSGENVGEEVNAEVNAPVNNENVQPVAEGVATEPQAEEAQPEVVEEVQQPQQQAPIIPTKEDGSIDFVSYGKDNTFKTLGEKYGEKMPNKVAVTAKALAEDLVKAQEKLAKAEEAYDNAPIGREQKAEQARDKAKAELESIQREADFWSSLDNEIKEAQAKRDVLLNPKADVDMSEEPMTADEFIAQQLANGNIALESASYKKETGYGEKERQKFIKMFRKAENGGMSIESAGDLLMQMDRENGTNFFNQDDANAGRDALINFLGSVSSWGDVTGYIRNNREAQAAKETEGLRNEIEDAIEANYHMTPEEYATLQEMESTENPFEGVDIEAKDAIFAEAALEYEEYLKSLENGQGTTEEVIEGNSDVLSEEQSDNTGGTEQRQGEGLDVSEGTVQSDDAAQEESAEVEEGNTPFRQTESILEKAERIANEEARRKPLRQRAKEWEQKLGVKVNIIENFDDVTNKDAKRAIRNGQRVTGWYEESTGEVCLYMPYLESAQEIDATYIHEVVAHKGLRGLLGDKFDEFLDDVWNAMSEADKLIYLTYPGVNGNKRAAADEYIAHLAENIDVTESAWGKLAELIKKFLKAIGLEPKMTHADIANTIKLSYQRLLSGEGGVDVVGDGTRFNAKKKKELSETVSDSTNNEGTVTSAVSNNSNSSANIQDIIDILKNIYEKKENKTRGFITTISKALGLEQHESSHYGDFKTPDGKEITLRISNHNAKIGNFDSNNENEGISIVISKYGNKKLKGSGKAHVVEFFYLKRELENAKGKPLAKIIESLGDMYRTGEYRDATGLAERQEVNGALFRVKDKNDLIAVHNISEDNLRKVLEVGSLVMPSIAITKVDMGHEGYGEISLLFDKETINPSDRRNKVYGGDAWTPRFPRITPKISEKVSSNVKKKIYELIEDRRLRENYKLSSELHFDQIEKAISDYGVDGYYNKEWMKLAYLLDNGKKVKVPMKMKDYGDMSETIIAMAKDRGLKVSDIQQGGFDFYNENKDFVEAVKNIVDERKLSSIPEDKRAIARKLFGEKEMRFVYFDTLISAATRMEYDLEHGGLQQILDRTALRETIEKKVKTNNADYNKWVDNLFDGIVEKYGIRNERDWYTPSGNLRPWEQLYNNVTPANILRYMLAQSSQGGSGGLFDSNIMGAAAETYDSIEEIREKGKKRLRRLEEGEYDEWSNSVTERVSNITYEFLSPSQKEEFGSSIDAMIAITNAVAKDKTANGIYKEMKSEYPRFTMDNAKELEAIVKEIQEQAIGYFEAKPQRIVSLSEVRKAVVPSNVSEDILEGLQNNGIEIATYKKGNEASRKRVIKKESEGIRFRFIGERGARNLDKAEEATTRLDNLAVAREMEAAEKDTKTVKMATGWERGADGLWRYEVDDNLKFDLSANVDYRKRHPELTRFEDLRHKYNAYLLEIGDPLTEEEQKEYDSLGNEFGGNTELHRSRKLKDYVDAPELFEAYPELRNIDLSFVEMDRNTEGKYLANAKSIQLNENIKFAGEIVIGRVLVHEIQHAIQRIEGFEPGANENMQNPNKVQQKASNIEFMQKQLDKHIAERNELLKKKDELNDKMSAWYDAHDDATAEDVANDKDMQEWNREYDAIENELENADRQVSFDEKWLDAAKNANTKLGYEGYRKVSGEVEARNVSRRMMLSADDRRNMLAVETEDVAREDQIFLMDGIERGISVMRFRISNQNQEIFVSNAQKAVEGIKQEKATPQQWLAMIEKNGGLKAGEDKWLGLSDWLKASDAKTITKSEILDFINQNKIQIEEVHYEEEADMISKDEVSYSDEFQSLIDSLTEYDDEDQPYINKKLFDELKHEDNDFYNGFSIDYWGESIDIDDVESAARYLGLWGDRVNAINNTRLGLTTKGLENNREIALTVPTIAPYHMDNSWDDEVHFGDAGDGRAIAWIRFGETFVMEDNNFIREVTELKEPYRDVNGLDIYKTNSGSDNDFIAYGKGRNGEIIFVAFVNGKQIPVAHKTLEDAMGEMNKYFKEHPIKSKKKQSVLVIDEIQSKRHQEGRDKGYRNPVAEEKLNEFKKQLADKYPEGYSSPYMTEEQHEDILRHYPNTAWLTDEERSKYQELQKEAGEKGGVPSAPFEKNWHELAFKRMLRYAAENGFDKVAWTTGAQQAERYNLSAVVDHIAYYENEDGTLDARAYFPQGGYQPIGNTWAEIENNVGKDIVKKMQEGISEGEEVLTWGMGKDGNNIKKEYKTLSGENLKLGGEGMDGFYDKMLPSFVNKYVKKWGTKVQDIELPELEDAGRIMHSVDVTEAMKESVMEGQTMFRIAPQEEVQAEVDKFTSKYNGKEVVVLNSTVSDEELESLGLDVEDVREAIEKETEGFYDPITDKIYIFADIADADELEKTLFHENGHGIFRKNKKFVNEFNENSKDKFKKGREAIAKYYKEHERAEELFVRIFDQELTSGNFEYLPKYLSEELWNEFNDILKDFGYDRQEESDRRRKGSVVRTETDRGSEKEADVRNSDIEPNQREERKEKGRSKEQAERLKKLFDDVADMGLRGVLGNTNYDLAMLDVFYALPEKERTDVAVRAVKIGGDVAVAVDEYLNSLEEPTLWEKVIASITNALRKVGIDVQLTENDVKYLLWRSRKPLDRNSIFDMAEDIDMRRKLNVGKFDNDPTDGGDTPGGGTRFRVAKEQIDIADERTEIIKKYDKELESKMFNFQESFQDRMLSLKVLMDLIENETGKKAKSFEDAYTAENQLGSINRPAQLKWLDEFYKPLLEELNKLSKKYGQKEIERYIYCKSGLERNEVLRQRDADETFEAAKAELDEKLAKNQIDQAQYQILLQQADDERKKTLATDTDYSGIRGLLMNTRADDLYDQYVRGVITEAKYKQEVADLKKNEEKVIKDWKQFAENQVANIDKKAEKAELDALWDKINAATNETLRIDFESGMIDRDTYNAEKKMMKYYVPLRNWENTTAEEMYEYRHDMTQVVSSNQKRAKGRKSQADNPIATIALMAQNAIVRGNRNKMKQKLYSFVANRETSLASVRNVWYVRNANNQWEPQYADTSNAKTEAEIKQIMEQFELDMQKLEAQGDAFKGKLKQGMGYRANRKQKDEHVVTVMVNGKEYGVYINGNPRAAQAVNGLTNAEGIDDAGKWIDNLKRYYGAGLTSWNPDFIIPNLVRDSIHAATMTFLDKGAMSAAKYIWNTPKVFSQVFKEVSGVGVNDPKLHQYFEEFVTNGGETGYTAIHTLEDYKKEYDKLMNEAKGVKASMKNGLKEGISKLSSILEAANRIAEDVNRFNAYVTSREEGYDIVKSIDAAKNITVNFNRKGALASNTTAFGKVASLMSRWILFFNPGVQGIYQLVTKSKLNPKRAKAIGATILASGFFMPMINELLVAAAGGDDEDDYWNQTDFKRRNNWMLFTGDGYVTIPLPPVLRELYGIGDIMYGIMTGHINPSKAVYDTLKQIQSAVGFVNLLPEVSHEPDMITYVKGFAPDVAAPILDIVTNTNFMGSPIAKWTDYNEFDPEYMRVYKGVSPVWKELSMLLNEVGGEEGLRSKVWGNFINPAMMEHLITSYTGGIGKTINNVIGMTLDDKENIDLFRKSPILPRFYTPNDEKTVQPAINRKYYDFDYEYNRYSKALKKYEKAIESGEHPEWQKHIDEMEKDRIIEFINYFKAESKVLKKLTDKLKADSQNKELERDVYDKKAEIATNSFRILRGN